MIGARSIIKTINISNKKVYVQLNKNHGICDIVSEYITPEMRSEFLNHYQGRPFHGAYTEETINDFLTYLLNK